LNFRFTRIQFIFQPVVADKFTQWIINRVKELNSSVDAEVFANFIAQVDSPDEVFCFCLS